MNFDRYRAQTGCESIFKCSDFEQFYNIPTPQIESFLLNREQGYTLTNLLKEDAKDLYFKGCQSLTESLTSFNNKLFSWATIKAYYAAFYMVRADFAVKGFALIRHKCIYYLEAREGCAFITKARTSKKRADYSGDHKATFNYYVDLFSNTDILLSQEIEGLKAYHWLMKKREQVNYQERDFKEPQPPDFLAHIYSQVTAGKFLELIDNIKTDWRVLLFQPEFAPIAVPLIRAVFTKKSFSDNGITDILTSAQMDHLSRFAPYVFK